MPELPEVETVRRSLLGSIVGQRISALRLNDFLGVIGDELPEIVEERIAGHVVKDVRRRAKYLIIDLDDDTAIVVHLRMTGRLTTVPHDQPQLRFERAAIVFESGLDLRFSDQRKFGRIIHLHADDLDHLVNRLGVEPLSRSFTASWLEDRLRRRPGLIKVVLLDQSLIGGLGNIYVDEALFQAGINPERRANTLMQREIRVLHAAIRRVLRAAIDKQGTTFSSFEDSDGNQGRYGGKLLVYGRGGKGPCPRCGTPLERIVVAGRGTSFCPVCQPAIAEESESS